MIGLKDINGREIQEGDELMVYAQRYKRTLVASGVYEVDQLKPLAIADVPLARGIVQWDSFLLAYVVSYLWTCEGWRGKAGAMLGGGEYAFEICTGQARPGVSA